MKYASPSEIDSYIATSSSFVDFKRFEGDEVFRQHQKAEFIDGAAYAPSYDYPNLDRLYDAEPQEHDGKAIDLAAKKHDTYKAILELEANKDSGYLEPEEYELYASFHETRLMKMLLVEEARRMRYADNSAAQATARHEFMRLNKELFGEMHKEAFVAIMHTEHDRVQVFDAHGEDAQAVRADLEEFFKNHVYDKTEKPLLTNKELQLMQSAIKHRYRDVLATVPDTPSTIIYDAAQSRDIIQDALNAGGFGKKGWVVEVNPKKSNPTTSGDVKKIYLPSNTQRTADQLRRLIVHEVEVHARRAQNGAETGVTAIQKGTADYADVEEGLGVLLECIVAGDLDNQSFNRARDRYITAGLALGVDGAPRDASGTFDILWRLLAVRNSKDGTIDSSAKEKAKEQAMTHIENAFRGTSFVMPGVIYSKLKVYYEGFSKNAEYFSKHINDIDSALDEVMIGKFNHTDPIEKALVGKIVASKQTM